MARFRTQLLLEPEQHAKLQDIAEYEQRSLSDVVREAVDVYLTERSAVSRRERGAQALARATELRRRMRDKRGGKPVAVDLSEVLEKLREERDRWILEARGNDGSETDRH